MALRVSRPRCSHTEDYARNIEQTGSRHFQKPAFELASLFYVSFVLLEFHVCIRVSVVVQLFYSFINYSDIVCAHQKHCPCSCYAPPPSRAPQRFD